VGRTGSGKSTLANVLSDGGKFSEVAGSTSGTKRIQSEVFEWNGNHCRVIDTVGTDDTKLSSKEMISTTREIVNILRGDGIKQVIFVVKDRFTKQQVEALKLFKSFFFKEKLTSCITIICSNFPEFEDKEKCDADIKRLKDENKSIVEVINNCKVIHIDNPPLHYKDIAIQTRKSSRKKLFDYLEFTCKSALDLSHSIENIDAEKIFEEVAKNNQTF